MTLFPAGSRTDSSPARYNETTSAFLGRIAGEYWDAVRELISEWFSHLPPTAQSDVGSRLTRGDDEHFAGALLELYLHEVLLRSGYAVDCHPDIAGTSRRPDFLARSEEDSFYLEARTLGRSGPETASGRRVADVYEALDRVDSPNFFLWIDVTAAGVEPLPTRRLRDRLERWLETLDPDEGPPRGDLDAPPEFHWAGHGWDVNLRAIPKSADLRGQPGVRPLGMFGGVEAEWVDDAGPVRAALRDKGRAYGRLDHGLVIALGTSFFSRDDFGVTNALFGTEQFVVDVAHDGTEHFRPRRAPDGYFYTGGSQWARPHVSGVLVVNNLHPARLSVQLDTYWEHPDPMWPVRGPACWARREVASGRLQQREPSVSTGELLGLAPTWPPGEPFPDP